MPELVPVRVRDCACPDAPHADGDIVYIAPRLSLEGGIAAQQDLVAADGDPTVLTRLWLVTFVRYGARSANFLDPFDIEAILSDFEIASPVAEACNDRYAEAVLRPLGLMPSPNSRAGRTGGSTSRTRRSPSTSPA